jgi:hypothetical protein
MGRVNIPIPKGGNEDVYGEMESKQDQNPAVQTLSPVTPGL